VRVVVTGASGLVGHALRRTTPDTIELVPLPRAALDITDHDAVSRAIDTHRPDWLINTAAYTAVDQAEREEAVATRINGDGVRILATAAREADVGIVHFSTDYVFDGSATVPYTEADVANPSSAYGRSKLAGEQALRESGARALLIRTQWLFGADGKCFPRTMWARACAAAPTRVVDDQFGVPTSALDLAAATWALLGEEGTLHVVSAGIASWYDVARRVFDAAGAAPDLLTPCDTAEYPTPARRPAYAVLDDARLDRVLGRRLPRWEDALDRFLIELRTPLSS
jgi:dTDP-4-dehydrorhamnose reductase